MSSEASVDEMCRACMRSDGTLLPMFHGRLASKNLPRKLAELASVQIDKDDGLPSKLCATCAYRTHVFHEFKMQVRTTENELRALVGGEGPSPTTSRDYRPDIFIRVAKDGRTEERNRSGTGAVDLTRSRNSPETVDRRDGYVDDVSPKPEIHDTPERQAETFVGELEIDRSYRVRDSWKRDDSEYAIVYLTHAPENHLANENEKYVLIDPREEKKNYHSSASESETGETGATGETGRFSVKYESKSQKPIFVSGRVVEGEDSEGEERYSATERSIDSDHYVDPKDNVLGSLNDTVIKIKEIRTDDDKTSYRCTLCVQNYEKLTGALYHVVDNHVPATGPFYCTVCEKDCDNLRDLRSHVKVHAGSLPYVCFICRKAYPVKRYLKRHMVTHREFFRHRCPKCGKRFETKDELQTHVTSHIGGSPYTCGQCPRVFNHKGNYKRHLITHLDPRGLYLPKFPCEVCGKRFLNNRALETHLRVHTGEKPYKCDTCNKFFSQQGNLLNHKKIHSNPRSYTCEVCGKQFNQRSTLKDHSLLHTGEKPYVCTICGIAFTFSAALRRHIWTHAGDKPHGCDVCDARFVGKYELKRHMRIHCSDTPKTRRRKNPVKEDDYAYGGPGEIVGAREVAIEDNAGVVLIEPVILNQDVAQALARGESEKENVQALLTFVQYGE